MAVYDFSIPSFLIEEVRSPHTDMLWGSTALKVMNANGSLHKDWGSNGAFLGQRKAGGGVEVNLPWLNVDVPDPTPENPDGGAIYWTFLLANKSDGDSGWLTLLNKAADALAGALAGKTIDALPFGPAALPVLALTGAVLALQEAMNLLNADCNGPVASGIFAFTASQLANMTASGQVFKTTQVNPGTDSPAGCGSNSRYDVNYEITSRASRITELRLAPQGWFQADLSALAGNAAPAAADPFAYVTRDGVPRVVYQGLDGHVHELRLEAQGWFQADLSALVGNSPAFPGIAGHISAQVTPDGVPRVVYRGQDDHVHELRLESQGWFQADLTALAGNAAPAGGNPFAYLTPDGVPRVVYRGQDHRIHELRLESQGWFQADLSALAGNAAPPFGDPFAYVTRDGVPRVVYQGADGHVTELRLESQGWFQADLSALVGNSPPAFPGFVGFLLKTGKPSAQVTPDGVPRVVYRGQDNHVHELRLESQGWFQADLTALAGNAAPAGGDPFAYLTPDGVPRVVYRGQDNHVHELRLESQGWFQADLTALAGNAAPAGGDPFAYVTRDRVPRVIYWS